MQILTPAGTMSSRAVVGAYLEFRYYSNYLQHIERITLRPKSRNSRGSLEAENAVLFDGIFTRRRSRSPDEIR
jgi:hypothetical protein